MNKGRLKRVQEEVKHKLATLKGQEDAQERHVYLKLSLDYGSKGASSGNHSFQPSPTIWIQIRLERDLTRSKETPKVSKCKIPPFLGNCKPKTYVDCELNVVKILGCFNLCGRRVVRLVTFKFGDYALVWWT
ncbi:hypothetical protein CR513_15290, partial [Mucuna pruriens]